VNPRIKLGVRFGAVLRLRRKRRRGVLLFSCLFWVVRLCKKQNRAVGIPIVGVFLIGGILCCFKSRLGGLATLDGAVAFLLKLSTFLRELVALFGQLLDLLQSVKFQLLGIATTDGVVVEIEIQLFYVGIRHGRGGR